MSLDEAEESLKADELKRALAERHSSDDEEEDYAGLTDYDYAGLDMAGTMPIAMTPMRNTLPVMEVGGDLDMGFPATSILPAESSSEGTGALGMAAAAFDDGSSRVYRSGPRFETDIRGAMASRRHMMREDEDTGAPGTAAFDDRAPSYTSNRYDRLMARLAAGETDLGEEPHGDRPDEGYEHLGAASLPPAHKKSYNWDE